MSFYISVIPKATMKLCVLVCLLNGIVYTMIVNSTFFIMLKFQMRVK